MPTKAENNFFRISRKKTLKAFRDRLLEEQNGRCFYCHHKIPPSEQTVDHKVPRSKGGGDGLENLVLSCSTCNWRKGNLTHNQFKKLIPRTQYHKSHYHRKVQIQPYSKRDRSTDKVITWGAICKYGHISWEVTNIYDGPCSKKQILYLACEEINEWVLFKKKGPNRD